MPNGPGGLLDGMFPFACYRGTKTVSLSTLVGSIAASTSRNTLDPLSMVANHIPVMLFLYKQNNILLQVLKMQ